MYSHISRIFLFTIYKKNQLSFLPSLLLCFLLQYYAADKEDMHMHRHQSVMLNTL